VRATDRATNTDYRKITTDDTNKDEGQPSPPEVREDDVASAPIKRVDGKIQMGEWKTERMPRREE
jgi:hypothetical protein